MGESLVIDIETRDRQKCEVLMRENKHLKIQKKFAYAVVEM